MKVRLGMLDQAIDALGVGAKDLQEFEMEDTFNGHLLRGYLCRRPDHRYGTLYLTHVNGEEETQLIFATPKLHYPFDRAGTYRFPLAREVLVFEKLDGTNILGFCYHWREQSFLTYKLRLSPIVRNSPHGPFLDLWMEILQQHPEIPSLPALNGCAISFELYGARNKHLVVYDVPLAVAVLFGVAKGERSAHPRICSSLGCRPPHWSPAWDRPATTKPCTSTTKPSASRATNWWYLVTSGFLAL